MESLAQGEIHYNLYGIRGAIWQWDKCGIRDIRKDLGVAGFGGAWFESACADKPWPGPWAMTVQLPCGGCSIARI